MSPATSRRSAATAVLMGLLGGDAAGDEVRAAIARDPGPHRRACRQRRAADGVQDPLYRRPPADHARRRGACSRAGSRRGDPAARGDRPGDARRRRGDPLRLRQVRAGAGRRRVRHPPRPGAPRARVRRSEKRRFPPVPRRHLHHPEPGRAGAAPRRLPTASDDEVVAAAKKVLRDAKAAAILATRSDKGMVLVEASGPRDFTVHFEPARAREVFDVSGAGDTVIAVLALAHASGRALPEAMRIANAAAGIVVCKLGTATVELDELMLELSRDLRRPGWPPRQALQPRRGRDAGAPVERARAARRVHQWLLRYPASRSCIAAGGGARAMRPADRRAQQRRQRTPAQGAGASGQHARRPRRGDRRGRSRSTPWSGSTRTPRSKLIRRLLPDVLMKGADWTVDTVVGRAEVEAAGGRVALIDLVEGHSTTGVIGRMRAAPAKAGV